MKKLISTAIFAILFAPLTYGQDQVEPQKATTKLEAFQVKSGSTIIKGFTTVGIIKGEGAITVDAREFRDASNPKTRTVGVSLTVSHAYPSSRENTAYIDSDEIESLIAGIDYISKVTKEITPFTNFEAEYRTKGHLEITVFNRSNGKISAAISAGRIGKTSVYIDMEQLAELKQLIIEARSKL
ncbi:MAG: hypothetical protein B7Y56_03370 [Gallionellales bacterium 35-53-114]|jgi:hypothetical protein|nr:MAG: hypothetical protein B7Y56_03370 [Gallionellales bacterium 35-53-114]OYZ65145.1 MAG: hypothetical protein B7Y04_00530 [Gallionellales bacterium 24-53-125]OZB08053.1 MAG: hypothetical protein B7X61_10980 [Gallionellales bacterium 39-52-133]HQS59957.1 hypothetical protein [Gallionellaceae bacterium]HQS76661.1 hypothetical protein [Gallionellaceae bacterium]